MVKTKLKKNDIVRVIAGKDKGKEGRVLTIDRKQGRVLVEHVMMMKKHVRPNPARQIKGGVAERESMIDLSNVMIVASGEGPVRLGAHVDTEGRRTRVSRKSGTPIEKK